MNAADHRKKTVAGLKWNTLSQFFTQFTTFGIGILLMRLLDPSDFGTIAMITVFTAFIGLFKDFGLTRSLIQRKEINDIDKNTVFYTNFLIGLLLAIVLFFSSGMIASFYNDPKLLKITKVISLVFVIQSLGMVHHALMIKMLDFKKVFITRLLTVVIAGSFAVYFALNGFGVWTLVYQQIISAFVNVLVVWTVVKWTPNIVFSFSILKSHLKFGLPLLGSSMLTYWSRNMDNLLIGKFMSSEVLGLYSRGYNLMMLPINQVSKVISNVMMPSFSIIQDDKQRIREIYLKIARFIAFFTFPMMSLLFVVSDPFVTFVFGEKWLKMIPLLKIFALIGGIQSLLFLNGVIYTSTGNTSKQLKVDIFSSIIITAAFIIGIQISISAVVEAYLIATLIVIIPNYYFIGKIISIKLKDILFNLLPQIFIAILISLLGILSLKLIKDLSSFKQLLILISEMLVSWLIFTTLFNRKMLIELKRSIKEFKN